MKKQMLTCNEADRGQHTSDRKEQQTSSGSYTKDQMTKKLNPRTSQMLTTMSTNGTRVRFVDQSIAVKVRARPEMVVQYAELTPLRVSHPLPSRKGLSSKSGHAQVGNETGGVQTLKVAITGSLNWLKSKREFSYDELCELLINCVT